MKNEPVLFICLHVWFTRLNEFGAYEPDPIGILGVRLAVEHALTYDGIVYILVAGGHKERSGGESMATVYERALRYELPTDFPGIEVISQVGNNLAASSAGETAFFAERLGAFFLDNGVIPHVLILSADAHAWQVKILARNWLGAYPLRFETFGQNEVQGNSLYFWVSWLLLKLNPAGALTEKVAKTLGWIKQVIAQHQLSR